MGLIPPPPPPPPAERPTPDVAASIARATADHIAEQTDREMTERPTPIMTRAWAEYERSKMSTTEMKIITHRLERLVRRWVGNVLWQPIAALNWIVDRLYYRRRLMWLYDPKHSPLRVLHRGLVKIWSPFYVRDWTDPR